MKLLLVYPQLSCKVEGLGNSSVCSQEILEALVPIGYVSGLKIYPSTIEPRE